MLVELARKLRPIIEQAVSAALDDATALQSVPLFPTWAVGLEVAKDARYQYSGTLYRCKQDNCVWDANGLPSAWEEVQI